MEDDAAPGESAAAHETGRPVSAVPASDEESAAGAFRDEGARESEFGQQPASRFRVEGVHVDAEAIEVELVEFEPIDDDGPVVVRPAGAVDDDIVDAEVIDDAPHESVAALEGPSVTPALTAGPGTAEEPSTDVRAVEVEEQPSTDTDQPSSVAGQSSDVAGQSSTVEAETVDQPGAESLDDSPVGPATDGTPEAATEHVANNDADAAATATGSELVDAPNGGEVTDAQETASVTDSQEDVVAGDGSATESREDVGAEDGAATDSQDDVVAGGGSAAYGKEVRGDGEPIRQKREQRADPRNRRTDPEQILAAYPVTYDPLTLREQIEDDEPMWVVIDRLTDKLEYAERDSDRARLLSLRAVASRLLGDLDPALEDARAAIVHAEAAGELVRTATVRARLGHVLQWRGEFAEADRIYAEADSAELPARLRAEISELAGRSAFEQGRYLEAVNHLERALDLRRGADPDLVERIELALDTITGRAAEGWGPYPRTPEEIVGSTATARPARDENSGLFGYPGLLPPRYAQAQPFADGVAWVRRPEAPAWELIDESGVLFIDASSGYRAAGRFAGGLAWVSRDDTGGWRAIDKQNQVVVSGGFEDARPFHNGLALVRRGGWGVVDDQARMVVAPDYQAFATMLASGEPVDGFTEEGLAVVDAGEVYGVVDREGRLLVPPVHAALLIHPAAFLVADRFGLWGALDRKGEPLVELKYRDRADVLDEIEKLIKDSRPVL
ncbi:WG repeat-containing protein [Actinoplanes sp. TRM 88003]|uniref:WG repeat-containing protein n=1 Tax=Paractinoplanes aksuensis TaxID=2939490 RepID=A0ABT1DYR3_9ACTN|nr:WG repeat-containing protein [Actinoplanes aksuensis]MCO8276029.1 WG repeat-containing protein [Actinoplanes aksuensis]